MKRKWSSGSNSIDNMHGIIYNDRQMKGFLKIFIHSLVILNLKIHSLKLNKNKIK